MSTRHFSEEEIFPLMEIVMGMIVQLDEEEQEDDSTRKQELNEVRGVLDAVRYLPIHRTLGER